MKVTLLQLIASRLGWLIAWQWVWLVLVLVGLSGCGAIATAPDCNSLASDTARLECKLDRIERRQRSNELDDFMRDADSSAKSACRAAHGSDAFICR